MFSNVFRLMDRVGDEKGAARLYCRCLLAPRCSTKFTEDNNLKKQFGATGERQHLQ